MEMCDKTIVDLKQMLTAAQQEFDLAVTFHEIWKPAAYDQDLHNRLGNSYATQAFLVTRTALRREMVLALVRLWDTNKEGVRMELIWHHLRNSNVIDALAQDRADRLGFADVLEYMREDIAGKADSAIKLIAKYMEGGPHNNVLMTLRALRHKRLAHRQASPATAPGASATDEEIEEFYQDNSNLIHILLGLVNAMYYDPQDTARVFGFYAKSFWERLQPAGHEKQPPKI